MLSDEELNSKKCAGSSLPLLQRNLRRRYRNMSNLKVLQEQRCATREFKSMLKKVDKTAVSTMVNARPLKKLPFLRRNIYIKLEKFPAKSRRNDVIRKKFTPDITNVRRQYRVHYVKYEDSKTLKKNAIMTSCICPAYQCPICLSYKVVSVNSKTT